MELQWKVTKAMRKIQIFSKMLKVNDIIATPDKLQLDSMRQQFIDVYNWKEELPTSFEKIYKLDGNKR